MFELAWLSAIQYELAILIDYVVLRTGALLDPPCAWLVRRVHDTFISCLLKGPWQRGLVRLSQAICRPLYICPSLFRRSS